MNTLFAPLLLITQAAVFLAPGLIVALWLNKTRGVKLLYALLIAALVGSLIGYIVFWAYIWMPEAGQWLSTIFLITSWVSCIYLLTQKKLRTALRTPDILLPLILMLAVSLFYNATQFICQPAASSQSCYTSTLPMDNVIPRIFAENITSGTPTERMGDWLASDRPPLQTGIILAQGPLTHDTYVGYNAYQLIGSLLQCLWIPALWILLRTLKVQPGRMAIILGLCIITGFFFFNSIFVWPKLLAASLGMLAFCLLLFEKPRRLTWTIGGLAAGTAMLAHTGVVFTFLPLAVIFLFRRPRPSLRLFLLASAAGLVILMPWMLYQKFYDPPGDRLIKWHIGGHEAVDNRSFIDTLSTSYGEAGIATVATNKLQNIGELFGHTPPEGHLYGNGALAAIRDADFRYTFIALSVFNAGWIALCFKSVRKRLKMIVNIRAFKMLLAVAASSLAIWVLVMFGPRTTIIHQGSYLTMLLLFGALGAVITSLPRRIVVGLIAAQFAYFAVVWILSIVAMQTVQPLYIIWALVALALVGVVLRRTAAIPENK